MSSNKNASRLTKAVYTTVAMLCVVWLAAPKLTAWQRQRMAKQLAHQVENVADNQVKVPLRQLAALEHASLEPLTAAAASERAAVSAVARQILSEKWAAWKTQLSSKNNQSAAKSVLLFATALAKHVDELGPTGRIWAEALVLEMIETSNLLHATQTNRLLADCNYVLTAIPPRGPRLRTVNSPAFITSSRVDLNTAAPQPKLKALTIISEKALESNQQQAQTFHGSHQPPRTSSASTTQSNWSPNWKMSQTSEVANATPLRHSFLSIIPTITPSPVATPTLPKSAGRVVDVPSPQDMQSQAAVLRELSSEQLLEKLFDATFYEAGLIRNELRERGFSAAELAFMQQLTSSNLAVRLQLVQDVSVLPAATSRRWLRQLLQDSHPDVRLRALTALGTTNAAELPELARSLIATDEDPRVVELAARLVGRKR